MNEGEIISTNDLIDRFTSSVFVDFENWCLQTFPDKKSILPVFNYFAIEKEFKKSNKSHVNFLIDWVCTLSFWSLMN